MSPQFPFVPTRHSTKLPSNACVSCTLYDPRAIPVCSPTPISVLSAIIGVSSILYVVGGTEGLGVDVGEDVGEGVGVDVDVGADVGVAVGEDVGVAVGKGVRGEDGVGVGLGLGEEVRLEDGLEDGFELNIVIGLKVD
mmetsp:Transcript_17496/g.31580  ORF Transcript_17496/g.31580 Transcript_17496/m.31580 type:complete len:138 (-) Transcript_17496:19-432(-)